MKRVEVTWIDAASKYLEPALQKRKSVGYLVKKSKKVVVVAQTKDKEGLCDFLSIPRSEVKDIRKL